jgi:glycosyltransferase involved in cell wall biosynthesis
VTRVAVVYGARAGSGGLGLQATTAIAGLATALPVVALGPGRVSHWPLETPSPISVEWIESPIVHRSWFAHQILRRTRPGRFVLYCDRMIGRWAAAELDRIRPSCVYAFTQVGLEAMEWARARGIPRVLDNPNTHIRDFSRVYEQEWAKWVGGRYHGHPIQAMVERVEREYELADLIRVSSSLAKESMVRHGIPGSKVFVCPQPVNRLRFAPPPERPPPIGPLRVCYVGSLDLRKGFVYLLRSGRVAGPSHVRFELVGATGDRGSKALLARERVGLDVTVKPGDPVPAYHRAELFVLPSLEDGFGFVVAEAMSCGLPVVVSDRCGAAECVRPGENGWIVRAGDVEALAAVFVQALDHRDRLVEMGRAARAGIAVRDPSNAVRLLGERSVDLATSVQ